MPQSSHETFELEGRRRVADQLMMMQEELGDLLAWDSGPGAEADYNFLYVPDRLLVDPEAEDRFRQVFVDRAEDMPFDGEPVPDETRTIVGELRTFNLPERVGGRADDVLQVMRVIDDEMGDTNEVSLEHYVHLTANGGGRLCPATEPEETGLTVAWPKPVGSGGAGVEVVVVDTRWLTRTTGAQAAVLEVYDGHGSFAEAVARGQAPDATYNPQPFPLSRALTGPGDEDDLAGRHTLVAEGYLVAALTDAIGKAASDTPRVITMQAGCHTRRDRPLKAFERLWRDRLKDDHHTVVVCAAGNDATSAPLYPAASTWTWGVGSLDRNDMVSSFSNYRTSADVFVLGRNHINEFPVGRYTCTAAPNNEDERFFDAPWARWSGTSFAAPLLAGLLANHFSQGIARTPREEARNFVRNNIVWRSHPLYGDHRVMGIDSVVNPDFTQLPALN